MSEHSKIIVGLKEEELKDGQKGLYFTEYGREDGEVWKYKIEPSKDSIYLQTIIWNEEVEKESNHGIIYGINVVGTWNGAIDLEEVSEPIKEAKQLFKKLTGQEGKTYFVGEQV